MTSSIQLHLSEPLCLVYNMGIISGYYSQGSWENLRRFALKILGAGYGE